ncbi:aldo/keto reductase [Microbacterium sp. Marseille-Q6648]|jgi:L-glyceraldehyde 3-phosphate reductase|uniref:aldo/keto reductase n=1 Tax=Microbacterium sp. Marseille-Q6648 TaxID=2937991 RepID=UPI00203D6915|nr:aldo/keto reductase [Microbacterium sp. Marseille-Q6648]
MPIAADDHRLDAAYTAAPGRYSDVSYRRAGRSGIPLPAISLGLWQNFGRNRSADRQREIVTHAFDRGITQFDLANNYGPPYGEAERTFGGILARDLAPYRDELFVATKAGYDMWPGPYGDGGSRKYLFRSLEQSLTRLGTDYVDVFYSHRLDTETPLEETLQALVDIVRSGKALYAGISNYPADLTAAAADYLAAQNVRLLLHQPRYSLFAREPEGALFDTLLERGIGSAVFSPLAQGLLTDKYLGGEVPEGSRAADSWYLDGSAITEDYLTRIRGIKRIADEVGLPVAGLAVAWVLRHPAVTTAIIGASRPGQIDDAIAASRVPLEDAVLEALEEFAPPAGSSL